MVTIKANTKKKKVSKKQKSAWRKHVRIDDVEEFLEDKRLDERLGPPLSTVPNEELFKVDNAPSTELLSAKERRKLKANKPLKCFSALQSHSKVPDPVIKRNRVRTKDERKNSLVKLKEMQNIEKGVMKAKEKQAIANRRLHEIRKTMNNVKRGEFTCDIWRDENKTFPIEKDEWARTDTKKHNLRGVGIPTKTVIKTVAEKKSELPAIELPHPGMSYNPSYKDHQDLLKTVAEKELDVIKTEKHITRCTKGMFSKVTEDVRDNNWLVEMSQGLPSTKGNNIEDENEASDDEYSTVNPPVQNRKKTLKQRRNIKEQKKLERQRMVLKQEKKKITDIHQLKRIDQKLKKIEDKQKVLREKRKKMADVKKKKTKVLGPVKFEEPELDFQLGEDIPGNLRNLKMESNLLVDRFRSLQKRNIIAPTKLHLPKKTKVKKFTKPGHKEEDWKKTVAKSFEM